MKKDSRPALTRRVERHYRAILSGESGRYSPIGRQGRLNEQNYAMAAACFASRWRSRRIDLKALQRMVVKSDSVDAAFKFAREVPGANIRRLQEVILRHGSPEDMRDFASMIPGANVGLLEGMAVVLEIMDL